MQTGTKEQPNNYNVPVKDANWDGFADRIELLISMAGNGSEFARKCGVSDSVVRKWRNGESDPSRKRLIAIAEAFDVNLVWLATGVGPMRVEDAEINQGVFVDQDDYLYIPLYDVRASAGHGAWNDSENIKDSLAFKRQWIQQELGASPDRLCLIYVMGESMEPALHAHDVVLVDRSTNEMSGDGIYVLYMDGRLLIKRLQSLPGKKINVSSDNPAYKPFIIDDAMDSPDLYLIGKVVWAGRKL